MKKLVYIKFNLSHNLYLGEIEDDNVTVIKSIKIEKRNVAFNSFPFHLGIRDRHTYKLIPMSKIAKLLYERSDEKKT